MWRTTININDYFSSMKLNYYYNSLHPEVASPGGINDTDMLEIGNGEGCLMMSMRTTLLCGVLRNLLNDWGANLAKLKNRMLSIIKNTELIGMDQDTPGR